jgi:hypothetical protein
MFIIKPIVQSQIDMIQSELAKSNTVVTLRETNDYTIVGHGVTANAVFDPTEQTLTVTIVKKPFFITEGHIQNGILAALTPHETFVQAVENG